MYNTNTPAFAGIITKKTNNQEIILKKENALN